MNIKTLLTQYGDIIRVEFDNFQRENDARPPEEQDDILTLEEFAAEVLQELA